MVGRARLLDEVLEGQYRSAGMRPASCVLLLVMLLLAMASAGLRAAPPQGLVAADTSRESARREAVIASAQRFHEKGGLTARTAYQAIDEGAGSPAANDLGGLAQAQTWVDRFERHHDYELLSACVDRYFSGQSRGAAVIFENIVTAGHAPRVIASAERHSPRMMAERRAQLRSPSDSQLVQLSLATLLERSSLPDGVDPELVSIESIYLMALGTERSCVPSQRILDFLDSAGALK